MSRSKTEASGGIDEDMLGNEIESGGVSGVLSERDEDGQKRNGV